MDSVKDIILLGAATLLLASLWPVRRLLFKLPAGSVRRSWQWLSVLLFLMIGGVLAHLSGIMANYRIADEMVVPGLMLFGSWFIFVVSQLSASGIATARRLLELERQCVTDGLTGIYNRRHFDAQLAHEFQRSQRYRQPMSMMLIDIDHFKRLNDTYGHQTGDEVLRSVCEKVLGLSRSADIVARYGGEEIAVIAPSTTLEAARVQAERLRLNLAQQDFGLAENDGAQRVTISVGLSAVEFDQSDTPERLLRRADEALYAAKASGRNRVEPAASQRAASRVIDLQSWKKESGKPHRAA